MSGLIHHIECKDCLNTAAYCGYVVVGVGGAAFLFDWYSSKTDVSARFGLLVGGIRLGGHLGGTALPGVSPTGDWSTITCNKAFSINDLHGSDGWIESIGVGVLVTFSLTQISAKKIGRLDYMFEDQDISGFGTGTGASIFAFVDTWRFARVVSNKPSSPWIA